MLADELRHIHFPYCLQRQEDGRYVLLNRNYKPLGFMTDDWVTYADYPIAVSIKGLGPKMAARIDCDGREGLEAIFLYNDGCIPTHSPEYMKAYLKRLDLLMKLGIKNERR